MAKGTTVANAIVTVIPSMEGARTKIQRELPSMLSAASEAGGTSGGKLFGNAFSGSLSTMKVAIGNMVGNVLTSAVQSASGAIKDTLSDAFTGFADYQQLSGGVETLFKDSADIVMENSKNAFKNAGMSANEYMENVTGFSASLISSLGGDTEKAAQLADQAMVDMSDNANKMGSDLERITDAYGGFAKGNFTMLDNLKIGYGGTKTEMERLLKDAQALKEGQGEYVEYSIDSFADIVEAIHVVQDNMGITGTTAEEAGSTISGAINMAKKSWEDLLAGMANPDADMGQLAHNLLDSLKIAFENIKPAISQMLVGAFEAAVDMLDEVGLGGVANFLRSLKEGFESKDVQFALELLGETISWVGEMFSDAAPIIGEVFSGITGAIGGFFKSFSEATYADVFLQMLSSIGGLIGSIIDTIGQIFSTLAPSEDETTDFLTGIFAAIRDITDALRGFWDFISPFLVALADIGGTIFGDLVDIFKELGEAIGIIGQAAGNELEGAFDGITSEGVKTGLKDVLGFLKDGILTAIQWLKDNGPAIGEVLGQVANALITVFSTVGEILGTIFTFIGDRIADLVDFFMNDPLGQEIVSTVVDIATTIGEVLGTIFDGFAFVFGAIADWLGSTDENGVSTFEHIGEIVSVVFEAIAGVINGVVEVIDGALMFIKGVFEFVFGLIKGIVTGDFSEMSQGVEDIMEGAGKAIEGIWDAVCATIGKLFEGLGDTVKGVFDGIVGFITGIPDAIADMFSQIKLPELKIEGDWNLDPFNFQVPEIKFMAKGGFLDRTTVIAGEAGPELYWPGYDPYFDKYAAGIAEHLDGKTGGDTYIIVDGAVVNSTEEMKTSFYDNMMELKRLGVMNSGFAR